MTGQKECGYNYLCFKKKMPITKTRTIGKHITFCPKCKWYEINDEDKSRKCPKCKTWAWTIYEYKYFEGKKLKDKEAGLTDNDESDIHGESLKELKKIFDKGFNLIKKGD